MKLSALKEKFDHYLNEKASVYFQEKSSLNEAILYSLMAPGKRIRPLLVLGFAQGFKGNLKLAEAAGLAVEMIHTYSLIHDDLPAMDDDDFRRGRPSNHKAHGEALAILAGDSLLNLAPPFLIQELAQLKTNPELNLELLKHLMNSSGHEGMIKGQALDIKYETMDLTQFSSQELDSILRNIHKLKTGALITWCCIAGLYATEDHKFISENKCRVESIGQRIGLLFQMVDDVLDVVSTKEELGKTPGKDEKAGKLTYTGLHGLEKTKKLALELVLDLRADLEDFERSGGDWNVVKEILQGLEKPLTF